MKILEEQLKEAFDGLRMRDSHTDEDDEEDYEDDFHATGGAASSSNNQSNSQFINKRQSLLNS